jgi:NAD(P)-dependent dehydrogenase (short-subunit alcohol dehydrogenase family)
LIDPRTRFLQNVTLPVQGFPGLQSNWKNPPIDSGEKSYVGHGRLAGRKALITGGDSGIGRAIAIAFAREGADVAFNYLDVEESDAQVTAFYIKEANRRAFPIPGDLRNETFCAELVKQAATSLGGIDILVSHAGYARESSYIGNHTTVTFEQTIQTNIYAPFFLARAAVPLLPPGSAIIFTSSDTAVAGHPALVDYSATKAYLATFARALAKQLWPYGIRVNAVAPGPTMTNFLTTQGETTESIITELPLIVTGRLEQPVELAPIYVDLAEGISSYTSGSVYGASGPSGAF